REAVICEVIVRETGTGLYGPRRRVSQKNDGLVILADVVTMADKQQPQPQTQQTAVLEQQGVQQVQVQVQMTQPQQHDGSAPQAQPQAPGPAGPPQHTVQVPHQQPGTPTGVTVVSSGVGGTQCVQVPTSSIQLQQQMQQVSEWGHGRVQVIQQPLQNPTYLQQLYNTQGQLLMPSNLQLHPAGMNPSSIHVITAGKPFQPNQLPPQMITTQKSAVLQGQAGARLQEPCGRKPEADTCPAAAPDRRFNAGAVPNTYPGGIQSPATAALLTPNPIFIRGQQEGTGMFIQSPPPQIQSHNPAIATQAAMPGVQQMTGKPRQTLEMPTNIQPKQAVPRSLSNILPSVVGSPNIRPASSVSTQTGGSTQMNATSTQVQTQKAQAKVRTKPAINRTSPAPGGTPTQKADAANQTKPQAISPATQTQQQVAQTKMILTSTGTAVSVGTTTMSATPPQQATTTNVASPMPQMGATPPPDRPVMPVVSMAPVSSPMPIQTALPVPSNVQQIPPLAPTVPSPNLIVSPAGPQVQSVQPQQSAAQVQMATLSAQATPVGSMATQTTRDDTVSKSLEEQTASPITQSQGTPMETQDIPDPTEGQPSPTKEEKVMNGCLDSSAPPQVLENGVAPEEVRSEKERDKNPPKAMVKPQVLTHVIEGFVIQEASEPFAVNRSSLLNELVQKHASDMLQVPLPPGPKGDMAKCEFCGKIDLRSKFKKSKRFCSMACAKSKRLGMFKPNSSQPSDGQSKKGNDTKDQQWSKPSPGKNPDWTSGQPEGPVSGATDDNTDTNDSAASGPESSLSPSEAPDVPSVDMEDSSASESVTPASQMTQRIDGQALMLLKEDHLMTAMSMKLGPALKICAKIDTMRCDVKEK
ncbi:hypothetical protein C0J52_21582, partial [Blattella germanica]